MNDKRNSKTTDGKHQPREQQNDDNRSVGRTAVKGKRKTRRGGVLIESTDIRVLANKRDIPWENTKVVPAHEPILTNLFNRMTQVNRGQWFDASERIDVYHDGQTVVRMSLPCLVSHDLQHILSVVDINPTVFLDLLQRYGRIQLTRDFKTKQDRLLDSILPLVQGPKVTFASFLPLIQQGTDLKFAISIDRHGVFVEIPDMEESAFQEEDFFSLQDLVMEDDDIKTELSVLSNELIKHPRVAPIIGKLLSSKTDETSSDISTKGITV